MLEAYFYMWEFVVSIGVIALIIGYYFYSKIKNHSPSSTRGGIKDRVNLSQNLFMTIVGGGLVLGGVFWFYYVNTHELYISQELDGAHGLVPPVAVGLIGIITLLAGIYRFLKNLNM